MKYSINKKNSINSIILASLVTFLFVTSLTACGRIQTSSETTKEGSVSENSSSSDNVQVETVLSSEKEVTEFYSLESESKETASTNEYYLAKTDEIYDTVETIREFNENGDLVGIYQYIDGKLLFGETYKYDAQGMLIESYDERYDHLLRVKNNRIDSNTIENCYFDETGIEVKKVSLVFDEQGNKKEESTYRLSDEQLKLTSVIKYDSRENPVERISYSDSIGEDFWTRTIYENTYTGDLLIRIDSYYETSTEPEVVSRYCDVYSYTYDEDGNIAVQAIYNYDSDEPIPESISDAVREDHLGGHCYYTYLKRQG